jgi:gluconolactonase
MPAVVAVRPEFGEIVDREATPEKIGGGFAFTEGPVWHPAESRLYFSDLRSSAVHTWSEAEGVRLLRQPSGETNGNTLDHDLRLLSCEHQTRRISRTLPDGSVETVVDNHEGRRLNSPNDIVVAPNGDLYFTDPPYGLRQPDGSFAAGELPFFGVFRYSAAGRLTVLVEDFVRPNGLALSSDGGQLFVADTQVAHVRVFDVTAAGVANGRVFVETRHEGVNARPDGIKLDERGNLYVTSSTQSGVWVYDPDGRLLGQISVGESPANCAFGGEGRRTLFVTAQTSVYRVRLKVAGQLVPLR